jgi:hypothetical protein
VSTLKVDSVQRNLVFPAILKTDKGKVAVNCIFDREKLNSFPTVNGGFNFDCVHGERKIGDFRGCVNFFLFIFFEELRQLQSSNANKRKQNHAPVTDKASEKKSFIKTNHHMQDDSKKRNKDGGGSK